jgi:hypothetical protein
LRIEYILWLKIYMYTESNGSLPMEVGSRVRLKASVQNPKYHWDGVVSRSELGTIISIDDNGDVVVNFPKQSHWRGRLDEVELIENQTPAAVVPNASNVKVGDKLRITSDAALAEAACKDKEGWVRRMQEHLGKLATVQSVHLDSVQLEANGDKWLWGWGAVRFDSDGESQRLLVIGDRIELAQGYDLCADAADGPLSPGDLGTIVEVDESIEHYRIQSDDGCAWWYTSAAIVPVFSSSAVPRERSGSQQLSVGDEVKLSRSYMRCSDAFLGPLEPGEVGTLVQNDNLFRSYQVKGKNGTFWWYDIGAIVAASYSESDAEDEDDDSDQDAEDEDSEDQGRRAIPTDWGASHVSRVTVSSGSGSENLTNGDCGSYWQSDGEAGTHCIEVELKRPASLFEFGIIVDPSGGESLCPERLRVFLGRDRPSLRDLGSQTHPVGLGKAMSYLRLAGPSDGPVSVIKVEIEGSGRGSCGRNCRVVGVCVKCGPGPRVDASSCVVGPRALPGPDWRWGMQDGGAGRPGKAAEMDAEDEGWSSVRWEAEGEYSHRIEEEGGSHLAIAGDDDDKVNRCPADHLQGPDDSEINTFRT